MESWAIVEAHWRFFKTIYHNPIDIRVEDDPQAALQHLSALVAVGELYGGLESIASTIEAFIILHMRSFRPHLYSQGPLIVTMARKLEIGWLFKDMVCLACGDPTRDDDQVCRDYQTIPASIILEKREELQKKIRDVNHQLLFMQMPEGETDSSNLLVHDFRKMIIQMARTAELGPWIQYPWAYRNFEAFYSVNEVCPERNRIFEITLDREPGEEDAALCREISQRVIKLVRPLLVTRLSTRTPFVRSEDDGLTCIDVTDFDLPWNPWSSTQSLESSRPMQSTEPSP